MLSKHLLLILAWKKETLLPNWLQNPTHLIGTFSVHINAMMNRHQILWVYMCVYVCVCMYVRVCSQTHMHAHIDSASPVKFSVSFFLLECIYDWVFKKKERFLSTGILTRQAFHCLACMIVNRKTDPQRRKGRKKKTNISFYLFPILSFCFPLAFLTSFLCFVSRSVSFRFVLNGVVPSWPNSIMFETIPRWLGHLKWYL